MSDDAKKLVLARRARFVAAAIAGIGVATAACDSAEPSVCLSPLAPKDAGVTDADAKSDADPQPCLSPLPPDASDVAEPQVCLSPLPPDGGDGG